MPFLQLFLNVTGPLHKDSSCLVCNVKFCFGTDVLAQFVALNLLSVTDKRLFGQQSLFSDPQEEKQKKIDSAYDKIREKYGDDILKRGE